VLEEPAESEQNHDVRSAGAVSCVSKQTNVYSVSSHYKNAERNTKVKGADTFDRSANKDQTLNCDDHGFTRHKDAKHSVAE
jgi:hypothetical protein